MTNKERYRIFCEEKPVPLFMQAWWLDAVCVEEKTWDILLYEENGKILAVMPYHLLKKWGLKIILNPQLTQYNGVWFDYTDNCKLHKRYSLEKKVMDNLIDQLEALKPSFYSQSFHHSVTNWQPFYWKKFSQTTRYTYILKNIADTDAVFSNIHPRYRKKLRKSERELTIDFNFSPEKFYNFHKDYRNEKNDRIFYSKQLFLSIFHAATKREQGKIIAIRDKNNNLLSAIFFVWDKNYASCLLTVRKIIDGSNASIFMIWEAIKYLKNKTKAFDFEGSMIEGVANINKQFGAEQVPYFTISKHYSSIFKFLLKLKGTSNN
jgi:hypothetical protein